MTILLDDTPRCVVRPNDMKHLQRFLRNGKAWLLGGGAEGVLTHREADAVERAIWENARGLHCVAGGEDDEFFGTPL